MRPMLAIMAAGAYFCSCKSVQTVTAIPVDVYTAMDSELQQLPSQKHIQLEVEQLDDLLILRPVSGKSSPIEIKMSDIHDLQLYRYTFDVDILTIPFKIRPSVKGFPQQLNPNFSAAIYLGRRKDCYHIKSPDSGNHRKFKVSGVGYGYGAFIGLGAVTMNPFVTQQQIDYEYDGLVLSGGLAAIYDARKFNIGFAVGSDYLLDRNNKNWIYQGKPWFGLLFGINLN